MHAPVLRVARPTNDLAAAVRFYTEALGLDILARFEDHAGFDGVMLGKPGLQWHLELTHQHGVTVRHAPTPEHLLVLYLPDRDAWRAAVARVRAFGAEPRAAENPYWDRDGLTFEDPDGYRIVLQNAAWSL